MFGFVGVFPMRSEYTNPDVIRACMSHMTHSNALAMECVLCTGWRIDDVLAIRTDNIHGRTVTITEKKTGKTSKKVIPSKLCKALIRNAVGGWCFPSRCGATAKHRTRQAVYTDLRRCAQELGVSTHLSPHSGRKAYAVELYKAQGFKAVKQALNHDNEAVTLLYALSDKLTEPDPHTDNTDLVDAIAERVRQIVRFELQRVEKLILLSKYENDA